MAQIPVCILTAGQGSRMGDAGKVFNKATFPFGEKAVISHLMALFPKGTPFVIGIGYKGQQVQDYLELAHPNENLTFVTVDNYKDAGSGPGHSLLCCKEYLQQPFYFLPVDTLFELDLNTAPKDKNWVGVAERPADESPRWCNMKLSHDNEVIDIKDKEYCEGYHAFNGLLYVYNYTTFWDGLNDTTLIGGEHQISNGTNALMRTHKIYGQTMGWTDLGTEANFRNAVEKHMDFDFSKTDEAMYFIDNYAVKMFADEKIVSNRTQKATLNPSVFPKILEQRSQMYRYKLVPGDTLYTYNTPTLFKDFLNWLHNHVWKPTDVDANHMENLCQKFYHDKTMQRLQKYAEKYPNDTDAQFLNGQPLKPLKTLLAQIPWDTLYEGKATFFHGDLQFDNVIYDQKSKKFTLLDWRQDFGGEVAFGDVYYDLAKLYGGLLLNYDYIKKNLFLFERHGDAATVDFATRFCGMSYRKTLEDYITGQGLDLKKVRLLVAIIYLNMAPLHHAPFDRALYVLGTSLLQQALEDTWLQI